MASLPFVTRVSCRMQDAVVRNLQMLTESSQRLTAEIKSSEPDVPWRIEQRTPTLCAFRETLASGEDETVPSVVLDALLTGANPVKVWREYRGFTQDALAAQAGISKAYLCQIETGKREGARDAGVAPEVQVWEV